MPPKLTLTSYCTQHLWQGHADCVHCSIRGTMLFSVLPAESFRHLVQPIDNLHYAPGRILYREGESGRTLYSIRRGLVKLLCQSPDGNQRIVRVLGKGDVAGLELLDAGEGYHHTAVAVQELDVCAIPLPTLLDLQRHHPQLCNQLRAQLQRQVDLADHWIKLLNIGASRTRIAQLLLLLHRLGADQNGDIALLPREDMAAIVGMTKETASRVIAEFKRNGLLHKVAANLFRMDPTRLQQEIDHEGAPGSSERQNIAT